MFGTWSNLLILQGFSGVWGMLKGDKLSLFGVSSEKSFIYKGSNDISNDY